MLRHSKILFLCTANYYRSRFAEYYCNHLASELGLSLRADSAGLEMAKWRDYNPGDLSPHTIAALEELGIDLAEPVRVPKQFEQAMASEDVRVIALCEREHRPMVMRDFPEALDSIEFWSVEDVEFESPVDALRSIRELVTKCLEEYR